MKLFTTHNHELQAVINDQAPHPLPKSRPTLFQKWTKNNRLPRNLVEYVDSVVAGTHAEFLKPKEPKKLLV